ncbi:hypothetical protein BU23DRAFT_567799 [Bimuria novae-zelandiae CBS 107.79]|uniref:Uncharacterized protein n=1 Tax=Bimuria novae-zelandiae CBS 107.79 TaxID=1447943 RepID=A0A6A5VKR5_9PLEO|nr:hypothetical protein BU23DRAFT_567799 [Bimuria novae-zelandiae CBS 107.79]
MPRNTVQCGRSLIGRVLGDLVGVSAIINTWGLVTRSRRTSSWACFFKDQQLFCGGLRFHQVPCCLWPRTGTKRSSNIGILLSSSGNEQLAHDRGCRRPMQGMSDHATDTLADQDELLSVLHAHDRIYVGFSVMVTIHYPGQLSGSTGGDKQFFPLQRPHRYSQLPKKLHYWLPALPDETNSHATGGEASDPFGGSPCAPSTGHGGGSFLQNATQRHRLSTMRPSASSFRGGYPTATAGNPYAPAGAQAGYSGSGRHGRRKASRDDVKPHPMSSSFMYQSPLHTRAVGWIIVLPFGVLSPPKPPPYGGGRGHEDDPVP